MSTTTLVDNNEIKEDLLKFLKDAGIKEEESRNSYADTLISQKVYMDINMKFSMEQLETYLKIPSGDAMRIVKYGEKLKEQKALRVVQQVDEIDNKEIKEDLLKFLKDAGIPEEESRNSYADTLFSQKVYVDAIVDLTIEQLENRFKISFGDAFRITRHAAKLKEQKALRVVQQKALRVVQQVDEIVNKEIKEDLLKFLKDAGILEEETRNSYADSLMSDDVYVDIIVDLTREELRSMFNIKDGDAFRITRHAAKLKEKKAVPVVKQEDQQQSNTPLQQLEVAERPVSCECLRNENRQSNSNFISFVRRIFNPFSHYQHLKEKID